MVNLVQYSGVYKMGKTTKILIDAFQLIDNSIIDNVIILPKINTTKKSPSMQYPKEYASSVIVIERPDGIPLATTEFLIGIDSYLAREKVNGKKLDLSRSILVIERIEEVVKGLNVLEKQKYEVLGEVALTPDTYRENKFPDYVVKFLNKFHTVIFERNTSDPSVGLMDIYTSNLDTQLDTPLKTIELDGVYSFLGDTSKYNDN